MKYAEIRGSEVIGFRFFDQRVPLSSLATVGGKPILRPVTVVGLVEHDEIIQQRWGPEFEIKDDEVIERYEIGFKPEWREIMLDQIDLAAEERRQRYTTTLAGQAVEQALTLVEARAAANDESRTDWTFLQSDIGHVINPDTDKPVGTIKEAAEIVLRKHEESCQAIRVIKTYRMALKSAIRNAETAEEAFKIYSTQEWPL